MKKWSILPRMVVLFGLGAALTYGAADFLGGIAARRAHVLAVVLLSQLAGSVPLLLVLTLWLDASDASVAGVGWGAAAGVAGGTGVLLLYRGLARARMSVVAPVTGVVAAAGPVFWGVAAGERPSGVALAGVAVALTAVVLVAREPRRADALEQPSGITDAVSAGVAFAAFFILLDAAGEATGLWPLVGARCASLILIAVAAAATRPSFRVPQRARWPVAGAGILDVLANVLYLLAARSGLLALAAVLTSMYPAATVLLARVVLHERMARPQVAGVVLAGAGIALIGAGA